MTCLTFEPLPYLSDRDCNIASMLEIFRAMDTYCVGARQETDEMSDLNSMKHCETNETKPHDKRRVLAVTDQRVLFFIISESRILIVTVGNV